ncbi:MAG: class I SAM-dependent methyltransferase [Deltaproteobacteria bacterium]
MKTTTAPFNSGSSQSRGQYVLDNADERSLVRLNALAQIFDSGTIRHLQARGVAEGWNCLEVGAGSGSIARWLAQTVGARGAVLATDLDTRHLESSGLPNLSAKTHDIVSDPLPEGAFDLVHARLVFNSLPEHEGVFSRLVTALKPGGWLVVEDFETVRSAYDTPSTPVESGAKTTQALRRVLTNAGFDSQYGRSLGKRFRAKGLVGVEMEGRVFVWRTGSPGAALTRANREQLRSEILATGLTTANEFEADLGGIDHPEFETTSPILWTAWGQRRLA